jgi:3',5'-cyclic AMP phosphodiesterase CpdA
MATVAHFSDLHVCAPGVEIEPGIDASATARAAVAHVLAMDPLPELVVLTGDLVNNGRPEQYAELRACLEPLVPRLRLLPGNHDDLAVLADTFPEVPGLHGPNARFVSDVGAGTPEAMRIVGLDSHRAGIDGGRLDAEQLEWLDHVLMEEQDTPTIVFLHHPVVPVGIAFMDAMRLDDADADALGDVIERHGQVQRVASGHLHRATTVSWRNTVATTVPSTVHAMDLQLTQRRPPGWRREPGQLAVHVVVAGRIVSHLAPLADPEYQSF